MFVAHQRVVVDLEKNPLSPYAIEIECIGMLKAMEAGIEKGVTMVAHSVLYSAVRELVLQLTSRQPWGPLSIGISVLTPQSLEKGAPSEKAPARAKAKK
ncbi:MAG: hypothetical protein IPO00_16555 [Betaproteobacteria bacterium]|nr:hypothetical protein [Betaproteobacteria bacterium]